MNLADPVASGSRDAPALQEPRYTPPVRRGWSLAIGALFGLSSGCATTARLGGGPTLDTEGNWGGEGKLTLGFGAYDHPTGVLAVNSFGAGVGGENAPALSFTAGVEGVSGDADHHLRGALLFSNRNYLEPDSVHLFGAAVNVGYGRSIVGQSDRGFIIDDRSNLTLGPELQAELLGGHDTRGVFSLPLVFEAFTGASL